MKPSPHEMEQLLSRITDADLAPTEQTSLRRAVETDATAAMIARQYKALGHLLSSWRPLPSDVQWDSFSQQVSERVAAADAAEIIPDSAIDHLVRAAASQPMPVVDWSAFKSRVSNAVHQEALRETATRTTTKDRRSLWLRLGAWATPLAAAAAIALVVFLQREPALRVIKPSALKPAQAFVQVALYVPKPDGSISVTFDRTAPEAAVDQLEPGTAIAIGPARTEMSAGAETEAMDDGYLY